jgi:hypothetical protein
MTQKAKIIPISLLMCMGTAVLGMRPRSLFGGAGRVRASGAGIGPMSACQPLRPAVRDFADFLRGNRSAQDVAFRIIDMLKGVEALWHEPIVGRNKNGTETGSPEKPGGYKVSPMLGNFAQAIDSWILEKYPAARGASFINEVYSRVWRELAPAPGFSGWPADRRKSMNHLLFLLNKKWDENYKTTLVDPENTHHNITDTGAEAF